MQTTIYTIGHSNHSVADFCELLSEPDIQVVVDVRSSPYSRYVTWFNKREIEAELGARGFKYLFLGDLVGGKPQEPAFRDGEGRVDYSKIAVSEGFKQGNSASNKKTGTHQEGGLRFLFCLIWHYLLVSNHLEQFVAGL